MGDLKFDLFGVPIREKRGEAGRPSHEPTPELRNKVILLFAAGFTKANVAAALKLSEPTFRKHYFQEIKQADVALLRVRGRQIERLNNAAEAGNIGAEKELARILDRVEMSADKFVERQPAAPAVTAMGKKDRAYAEATKAHEGTPFEGLLGPAPSLN